MFESTPDVYEFLRGHGRYFLAPEVEAKIPKASILEAVLDDIADGLVVFDLAKTIVLMNRAGLELAGRDMVGMTRDIFRQNYKFFYDDTCSKEIPELQLPLERALAEGRAIELEGYAYPVGGISLGTFTAGWWHAHAAPVFNGNREIVGAVSVFHDITPRKRAEKQRDALNALITHDIKNHLTAVSGFLSLLPKWITEIDQQTQWFIDELKRAQEQYLAMSNTLLELSRANFFVAEAHGQPIDLTNVLNDVAKSHSAIAAEKNVTLKLDLAADLLTAYGLPSVINQIFHNIVLNAIEVSESGDVVQIKAVNCNSDVVIVSIIDQGHGLDAEQLNMLFKPERVASYMPNTTKATGFGLYLSAMLIESQGGAISCVSGEGTGTTIDVYLRTANFSS